MRMLIGPISALVVGGLAAAPIPKDMVKSKKKDEVAMLGTWQMENYDGPDPLPPMFGPLRLLFKAEGQVEVSLGHVQHDEGTYKLNPTAKVKELDISFRHAQRPTFAIYELNEDVLRIATADGPGDQRPVEFKSGKKITVMTFKQIPGNKEK